MPLLKDAFYCLASDSIKLASLKSKGGEDEAETEQDRAGMVLEAARKQIISGVVKKNVIENIIPIIIALKHKLESVNSPLLGELFNYLRKLMEDYKNEVSEILAADKQLAKEIEFDLRRHEQEERERKEREQEEQERLRLAPVRSIPNSPALPRPSSNTPLASPRSAPRSPVTPGHATPSSGSNVRRKSLAILRQALVNASSQKEKGERRQKGTDDENKSVDNGDNISGISPLNTSSTIVKDQYLDNDKSVKDNGENDMPRDVNKDDGETITAESNEDNNMTKGGSIEGSKKSGEEA